MAQSHSTKRCPAAAGAAAFGLFFHRHILFQQHADDRHQKEKMEKKMAKIAASLFAIAAAVLITTINGYGIYLSV